jgi:hypothetical protein
LQLSSASAPVLEKYETVPPVFEGTTPSLSNLTETEPFLRAETIALPSAFEIPTTGTAAPGAETEIEPSTLL